MAVTFSATMRCCYHGLDASNAVLTRTGWVKDQQAEEPHGLLLF
jgi:hypothetical protein